MKKNKYITNYNMINPLAAYTMNFEDDYRHCDSGALFADCGNLIFGFQVMLMLDKYWDSIVYNAEVEDVDYNKVSKPFFESIKLTEYQCSCSLHINNMIQEALERVA